MARNCHGECPEAGLRLSFDFAPKLRQCPWGVIDDDAWSYYAAFKRWTALGILPYGGTMGEQPQFIGEAFEVCERAEEAVTHLHGRRQEAELMSMVAQIKAIGKGG